MKTFNGRTITALFTLAILAMSAGLYGAWSLGYQSGENNGYYGALNDLLERLEAQEPQTTNTGIVNNQLDNFVRLKWTVTGATAPNPSIIASGWKFVEINEQGALYITEEENLMFNQGVERINKIVYDNVSSATSANMSYIGFSNNAAWTPGYTDTSCNSTDLVSANGLSPSYGIIYHGTAASGDIASTLNNTFTATGTQTITHMCLLYGTATGTAVAAADVTDATLANTDTLVASWILNTNN